MSQSAIFITDTHLTLDAPRHRKAGDWHHRVFDRIDAILDVERPDVVLHGGDFFHSATPPIRLVLEVSERIHKRGIPWAILPGNHDLQYGRIDRNTSPLHLLESNPYIRVLWEGYRSPSDAPIVGGLRQGVEAFDPKDCYPLVILLHHDIAPAQYRTHDCVDPAELGARFPKAGVILLGHIHRRFHLKVGTTWICNPGCFAARTSDEIRECVDGGYVRLSWYTTMGKTYVDADLRQATDFSDVIASEADLQVRETAVNLSDLISHHGAQPLKPVGPDNLQGELTSFVNDQLWGEVSDEEITDAVTLCVQGDTL